VEVWNWETIFYEHYRSIFNHCDCDIIGLKVSQFGEKMQNMGYYGVQGNSRQGWVFAMAKTIFAGTVEKR